MTRLVKIGAILLFLLAPAARADILVLKNGRKLRGGVVESGGQVLFNPYFSRHPGMCFDTRTFPREQVKEILLKDPPLVSYLRRSAGLNPDDFAGRLALAAWCGENRLKKERELELLKILARDPNHEAALKAFGRSKFKKIARGNPDLDPAVRAAVDEYLAIPDPETRKKAYSRLKRDLGVSLPQVYFDRMIRSMAEKKGLTKDRPLTLRATESPGVYTLFVPKEYDPRRAWPLVIGLHGGGRGGKDGKEVVGSGPSAMNFYIRQAAARGYLVACPTAIEAPWAASPNEAFLRALLEEITLLFHVDLNRIYLTGHSMGGFGTWYFGPKFAEEWAAISPMAGGGGPSPRLQDTNTPIFIFHGRDDNIVGPGSDRAAARALAKGTLDFVYTELDGVGHGFPDSIQRDLFDFFDTRRLAVGRGRKVPTAEVRSSFLAKVTRDERRYLGDPLLFGEADEGGRAEWKVQLKALRLGGGKAEAAAERLGELKAKGSVKPIGDLLRNPRIPDDVKEKAARALGLIGSPDGYSGLAAGLKSENHDVVTAAARAMASIRAPKSGEALVAALSHATKMIESKRIGTNRMHISDWTPWLKALTAVVRGVGDLEAEGGAAAIHRTAVQAVVAADWDVIYSRRIHQDPFTPRRKLAIAVCEALVKLGEPEGRAALLRMKKARADDAAIVAACESALAKLPE